MLCSFTHSENFYLFSMNSWLFLLLFKSSETNAYEVSKMLKSFIDYSVRLMENKFKIGLASETAESWFCSGSTGRKKFCFNLI